MNTRPSILLGHILFFLGVVTGLALTVIAIWNNAEATNYFYTGAPYPPFHGMRCPLMMTPPEKGIVTAVLDNPTDKEDVYRYRIEISNKRTAPRTVEDQITIPSRQSRTVQWTVDANDIDLGFFIFVKITVLPNAFHPTQEDTCGIMIVNIPFRTGAQVSAAALILSLLGMAVGLGTWHQTRTNADLDVWRLARALGLTVLLGLIATALGWWIVAIALSVITILLLIISMRFAID